MTLREENEALLAELVASRTAPAPVPASKSVDGLSDGLTDRLAQRLDRDLRKFLAWSEERDRRRRIPGGFKPRVIQGGRDAD